jgi:hypothetical protein
MKKVYLIRSNDGKYKIGISINPSKRIDQLNTGNPEKLELIESYESVNASKIETSLHNRYMYARQNGEWFDLSISEEVDFLTNCKIIDKAINILKSMGNIFI